MEHLEHDLRRRRRGRLIVCLGCSLRVERPAGHLLRFTLAAMRRW